MNKELLDLVNDNYRDFLSLGSTLKGGEERVEDVRVGLLGFQRELNLIRTKVDVRRDDVAKLLDEKRQLKQQTRTGRALLEIAERVDELEGHLMIGETVRDKAENGMLDTDSTGGAGYDSFSDDSEDEGSVTDGENRARVRKLGRLVEQYLVVRVLAGRHNADHSFIAAQEPRVHKIQTTLRLDIESALKEGTGVEYQTDTSILDSLLELRQRLDSQT